MEPQTAPPAPGSAGAGIFDQLKLLLLRPDQGWAKLETEKQALQPLFARVVAPLAAIPAVGGLVGTLLVGFVDPTRAVAAALLGFLMTMAIIYFAGLVIDFMADYFDAQRDQAQAMKIAAYSSSAACLAGVFLAIPAISFLFLLGAYSLFLLYRGLAVVMNAPEEKALGYAASVVGVVAVAGLITGGLMQCASSGF